MKKITRLYTGADGESHFDEIQVDVYQTEGGFDILTKPIKVSEFFFRESLSFAGDGDNMGWHGAPRRQFYVMLGGTLEIEVGDGTKRLFKAGDVFLAEDTTGRGHLSRAVNRRALIIPAD
jgi:quercetin dioxygenase-like cupin family protein